MKKTIFLVIILLCMTACNKVKPSSSEYNIDDESYDIGYSDGYDEGYEIGYDNGSMDGYKEAYDEIALEDLQADWEYYGYKDALMEIYTFLKAKGYKNILYDEYVFVQKLYRVELEETDLYHHMSLDCPNIKEKDMYYLTKLEYLDYELDDDLLIHMAENGIEKPWAPCKKCVHKR